MPGSEENDYFDDNASGERRSLATDELDEIQLVEGVYQLWWRWADFSIYIVNPVIELIFPPVIVKPDTVEGFDEKEFVYDIHDHGHKLITSKGEDMYTAGMSMCRMFYTIEKMVALLVGRLKSGGIDAETEVQIAFSGHEIAQRKAFESIINVANFNIIVTNFNPGAWGDRYLETVKRMAAKGYGYPSEAPRDNYHHHHGATGKGMGG